MTPTPEVQAAVAQFHQDHPAPEPRDDIEYAEALCYIDLADPMPAVNGMWEAADPRPSHAVVAWMDDRKKWAMHWFFPRQLTPDQVELKAIFKHTEGRDFPTLQMFLNFLTEVMPLPASNRAKLAIEAAGITEFMWQQNRHGNGKALGVRPSKLFADAFQRGDKVILNPEGAKLVKETFEKRKLDKGKEKPKE